MGNKKAKDKNKTKKCSGNRKLMFSYGLIQLGTRVVTAVSLVAIAVGFCSIKKETKLFQQCVEQTIASGRTSSESVHFCNGGN